MRRHQHFTCKKTKKTHPPKKKKKLTTKKTTTNNTSGLSLSLEELFNRRANSQQKTVCMTPIPSPGVLWDEDNDLLNAFGNLDVNSERGE